MSARVAAWLAWSLCALCVALAVASLILALLNGRTLGEIFLAWNGLLIGTLATLIVSFSFVGALIASHRPGNPIGWIFLAVGFCYGLLSAAGEYAIYALLTNPGALPWGAEASWLGQWIWAPGLGLILVFLPLLFPDGHPPSNRWRPVAWLGGLSIGLAVVSSMIVLWPGRGPALVTGDQSPSQQAHLIQVLVVFIAFPMMLLAGLGAVISLFVRFRRAREAERQQIKWFASAAALTLVWILVFTVIAEKLLNVQGGLPTKIIALSGLLVMPSISIATGIAILRYRLYDIDLIINRTLVYGALTAAVVGLYVLIVGTLGALFQTRADLVVSLLATGVIALLFAPLRERLQRGVNRLMYGERDDPYAVLSRLGRRLEATIAPEAALTTIVETIAQALKLPYVAILLQEGGRFRSAAVYGSPTGEPQALPLIYQREEMGQLVLSRRAPGEEFSSADRSLLEDLARQAEVAVHAVRLTTDLQRSRERLVATREEERRRIRRDLHDGLGPALSSAMLKLSATRRLLPSGSPADDLIDQVRNDMRATVTDVRRLVYDLRPPTLDELGLVLAIRDYAEQCGSSNETGSEDGLRVTLDAPEHLPPLPAAVEVAAYHIAREALTNAARHARARSCQVRLTLEGAPGPPELVLEITDDGVGLSKHHTAGVGLSSMRERAEELGGRCTIESLPEGGTRVLAHLSVGKK